MATKATPLSTDDARRLYGVMARIRHFEVTAERLQATGVLNTSLHLSVGQEGVAAGVCDALELTDYITSTHRGHGHCLAKGGQIAPMMGELFARSGGYCGGKSGSMHIADPASGILGANAIVGGGIPIAVGAALGAQQRAEGRVAVAFFGEGAVAEGVFHEALNIAALWRLPLIMVCENNGYAEMTPSSVHLANTDVAAFGAPYGVPSVTVDGNDVGQVREVTIAAVARARRGEGPSLIQATTHRWRGHYQGDPETYRSRDEVAEYASRDPLIVLREQFPDESGAFDDLDAASAHEVDTAVTQVQTWDVPGPDALLEHVYPAANATTGSAA